MRSSLPQSADARPCQPASRGRVLLEDHLDLIQRKLHQVSRRSGLPESEAEEFRSWALLKLVDDDSRILGRWEGRSSFSTFLTVVVVNLMRDYRTHLWGRWRPSAAARRRGEEAMILERLLVRDGLAVDEARERLREHGISLPEAEVARFAATHPVRQERRLVSEAELLHFPVDGRVEARVEERERERTATRLRDLLVPLFRSLQAEDRLLLKLYFLDGLSMAALAPVLGRSQRELFSMKERCLKKIRRSLEGGGLSSRQIRELVEDARWHLDMNELLL